MEFLSLKGGCTGSSESTLVKIPHCWKSHVTAQLYFFVNSNITLHNINFISILCWIPSHIGIQGNEMVDKQAKTSLSLEPTSFKIPFSNFKPSINKYILEIWQTSWNNSIGNKLLEIKPTIGEYQSVVRNIRREEVVLARLRLGHTRVTHSYLLQGEEQPQCVGCDAPFTVRHFLLECGDFAQVRNNCFHVNNMKELFQDIHIDNIMTFLRQINLFNKI